MEKQLNEAIDAFIRCTVTSYPGVKKNPANIHAIAKTLNSEEWYGTDECAKLASVLVVIADNPPLLCGDRAILVDAMIGLLGHFSRRNRVFSRAGHDFDDELNLALDVWYKARSKATLMVLEGTLRNLAIA